MPDSNEMFDKFKKDFDAAMTREVQIRTNYETGLIPTLERDLQAARTDVAQLTKERDELLAWKKRAEGSWKLIEQAAVLVDSALESAPSSEPPSLSYEEALPPSWRG